MFKKFALYYLPPLVALGLVLVRMSKVQDFLKLYPLLEHVIYGFLLLGTAWNYKVAVLSPLKRLQDKDKKKWAKLNENSDEFFKIYREYGLSMNIMTVERTFFAKVEPTKKNKSKTRIKIFPRIFRVVWNRGSRVNPQLTLSINQGVCGSAYTGGEQISSAILLPEYLENYNFNFNTNQEKLTSDLVIVASCRIELQVPTDEEQKLIILGVLNIESRLPGSAKLLLDQEKKETLYTDLRNFSTLYVSL